MTILEIKNEMLTTNKTLYFDDGGRESFIKKDSMLPNCWATKWGKQREVHNRIDIDEMFAKKCFGGSSFMDLFGRVDWKLE